MTLGRHVEHIKNNKYTPFHICLFMGIVFSIRYSLYQDTKYPTISEFLVSDKEYTLANIYSILVVGTDIYNNNDYTNIAANAFLLFTASFHTTVESITPGNPTPMKMMNMIHNIVVLVFAFLKAWVASNRSWWRWFLHILSFMPFVFMNVWERNQYAQEVTKIYQAYDKELHDPKEAVETKKFIEVSLETVRRNNYSALVCITLEVIPLLALYYPWDVYVQEEKEIKALQLAKQKNKNLRGLKGQYGINKEKNGNETLKDMMDTKVINQ